MLVVPAADVRFVLSEGYGRVEALQRLARDLVEAVVLEGGELDALVLRHRLAGGRQWTPQGEGWLVAAPLDHGKTPEDVGIALGESRSCVSRRLALVRTLPESAHDSVRGARVGANVAEMFLAALARANAGQCARPVEGLKTIHPTVPQMARLYAAWRPAIPVV